MKKTLSIICIAFIMTFCFSVSAFAVGDGNIDSGGGGMGQGTGVNIWSSGNDGVRVTVVNANTYRPVTIPIDLTNKVPPSSLYHFGKVSKISYNKGTSLSPVQGGYSYKTVEQSMPRVIGSKGNNIEAIKSYFTDEQVIRSIANVTGMDFDVLISGDYKLLLEPFAFYKFEGVMIASTATEAAMYDERISGGLRAKMGSLTHKNLPLSMFLEVGDLGFSAWTGSATTSATNAQIKYSLGLGIVRFEEEPDVPLITDYDYEYRVNTEVITSVYVSGGQSDPDDDTTVYFNIDGRKYTVSNAYYPRGDSQLVWVKWTTPSTPQEMTINVSTSGEGRAEQSTIQVNIVDLDENPPPNPVADDRNDSFRQESVPERAEEISASWNVWNPWWQEHWVWVSTGEDSGYWVDRGWWEFDLDRYYATLHGSMHLSNDQYNPTATGSTFKSGYGVNIEVGSRVSTNQGSAISKTPNAVSYFPEFNYETYWRLLERMRAGNVSEFEFQKNVYSTYSNRTHFTPIWMPDGPYKVNTWLIDVWTPSGMLSMNLNDELTVRGNLWDDWHIAPKDTN